MIDRLTGREITIMILLAQGKTGPEVAETLGLSHQTVKNHVGAALRALGARNKIEAFRTLGWLVPPEG